MSAVGILQRGGDRLGPVRERGRFCCALSTHHARAVAVVAVLRFGTRLVPSPSTALAGVIDVHHNLLVNTFCSLGEGQFHDVLHGKQTSVHNPCVVGS